MKVFGVFIALSVGLIAYLAGGLFAAMVAGFATFAASVIVGVFEFRRFMRQREAAIARQLSVS